MSQGPKLSMAVIMTQSGLNASHSEGCSREAMAHIGFRRSGLFCMNADNQVSRCCPYCEGCFAPLQEYLSSLQAELKRVRQVLADAVMAAQQAQLRRDRLAEKHAVVVSTVTPTATADQASAGCTMQPSSASSGPIGTPYCTCHRPIAQRRPVLPLPVAT
jgi:hypothetical protein